MLGRRSLTNTKETGRLKAENSSLVSFVLIFQHFLELPVAEGEARPRPEDICTVLLIPAGMLYDVATIINIVIVIMIRYRYGAGTYRLEMGPCGPRWPLLYRDFVTVTAHE